jgi:hypothetical protein
MKRSRNVASWAIVCTGVLVMTAGILAHQFNPQPDPPGHYFGLISVSVGQHVSLHVANRKMATPRVGNNDTCRAALHFVDGTGADLKTRQDRVLPGQSVSLNFTVDPPDPDRTVTGDPPGGADPPGEADPPGGKLLRAFVLFTGESAHCLSSVDVLDSTGHALAYLNPSAAVTLNPPSDRPGEIRR